MFNGRYGMDELGRFMLIVAAILIVLNVFINVHALFVIAVLLLILVYSRAFSRFVDKRRAENMKFLEYRHRVMEVRSIKDVVPFLEDFKREGFPKDANVKKDIIKLRFGRITS